MQPSFLGNGGDPSSNLGRGVISSWHNQEFSKGLNLSIFYLIKKRSKFSYEMIFGRTEAEMVEAIKRIIKDRNLMPILMFLYKDN